MALWHYGIVRLQFHNGTISQFHNLTIIAFVAWSFGVLELLRRFEDFSKSPKLPIAKARKICDWFL